MFPFKSSLTDFAWKYLDDKYWFYMNLLHKNSPSVLWSRQANCLRCDKLGLYHLSSYILYLFLKDIKVGEYSGDFRIKAPTTKFQPVNERSVSGVWSDRWLSSLSGCTSASFMTLPHRIWFHTFLQIAASRFLVWCEHYWWSSDVA